MHSIEDFHRHLNTESTIDRFDRWKIYRDRISLFITDHLKLFNEPPSVYIAGAGKCDDINLSLLTDCTNSIVLSDIDIQSMLEGVHLQQVKSVKIQQVDYLDIDKSNQMGKMERLVSQKHSNFEFTQYLNHITHLIKMNENDESKDKDNTNILFDVVISMPIYTQLFLPQVNQLLSQACDMGILTREDFVFRQRAVLDMMPELLDHYNKHLRKKLKENGILIVFSDLIEDKENGDYLEAFRRGEDFDLIMSEYIKSYGMGLGNYGLYQLGTECMEMNFQWFEWPFDNNRFILVKGIAFKVKKTH